MRKLSSFTFITLNGFMHDQHEDISWHQHGAEENQIAADGLGAANMLLFGRKTFEMMASYWPTPMALENDPTVAAGMNKAEKLVFSSTLQEAAWENTTIINGDITEKIRLLKQTPGSNMTLLGSGSILSQFAANGLIDDYLIMIDPLAIGSGTPIFKGIPHQLSLNLKNVQTFKSGVILLHYIPKINPDEK
ncbi:MAG: dihydrofolate reductase family protein [Lentimicrobium sp.]